MSSDDSFSDRVSSFISGNRRGIVIGAAAAAVAIGGVAYYVASSRAGSGAGDEESLREGRKKDKKKKKHRKSAKDKDGPILEEKKPKATEVSDDGMRLLLPIHPFLSLFCTILTRSYPSLFASRTRPTPDGGTDSGAWTRGEFCRPLTWGGWLGLGSARSIPRTGTQVARGDAEEKRQRRVPGPKVHRRRRVLHTRHRRVAAAGARVLQQPRGVLRQHGTAPTRKGGG